MGRKRDLTEAVKSGPGRKTKKQKPPQFPKSLKNEEGKQLINVLRVTYFYEGEVKWLDLYFIICTFRFYFVGSIWCFYTKNTLLVRKLPYFRGGGWWCVGVGGGASACPTPTPWIRSYLSWLKPLPLLSTQLEWFFVWPCKTSSSAWQSNHHMPPPPHDPQSHNLCTNGFIIFCRNIVLSISFGNDQP